ncbi:MAG: hypothetical protein JWQ69_3998 [Pseudomonas sp.]|nr:hypothetical protein [Pseudomonas sp.]
MMIVPTLCVGTPPVTLRVTILRIIQIDAERRGLHSHAERGNDRCLRLLRRLPKNLRNPLALGNQSRRDKQQI